MQHEVRATAHNVEEEGSIETLRSPLHDCSSHAEVKLGWYENHFPRLCLKLL